MRCLASDIARRVDGTLDGPDPAIERLETAAERVRAGDLYVSIVKDREGRTSHDVREEIDSALARGAAACLVARSDVPSGPGRPEPDVAMIRVADTRRALSSLGCWARQRLRSSVVAVTGSVGKTTVKNLLLAACSKRYRTSANPATFNNRISVPRVLFNTPEDSEVVILEMGAKRRGDIADLCTVARPEIGVITRLGLAHGRTFGSLEDVARAKAELIEALPAEGTAVIPHETANRFGLAARTAATVLSYGGRGSDVQWRELRLGDDLKPSFQLHTPWGSAPVALVLRGEHQAENAAAAAAAALASGVPLDDVARGLAEARPERWRMELARATSGGWVLNDSFNASPASTASALKSLRRLPARRRSAVLGEMKELGAAADAAHRDIAELARTLGIQLIAIGTELYGGPSLGSVERALRQLEPPGEGEAVLIKGSRSVGLERLACRWTGDMP